MRLSHFSYTYIKKEKLEKTLDFFSHLYYYNDNHYQKGKNMKKYSKQRETILNNLKSRTDHPTAEQLYLDLKEQMPDMGIATVYRNLSELCDEGEIIKIKSKAGADRFDGNNKPHIHFLCEKCEQLLDICLDEKEKNKLDNDMLALAKQIDGKALSSEIVITGICKNCS